MSGRPGAVGRRPARLVCALALALLAAAAVAETPAPDAFTRPDPNAPALTLRATLAVSRAETQLEGRRLLAGSNEIYVSSSGAAALFGARRDWQEELRRLTFRAAGRTFQLTAGSRLVMLDAGETLLRAPVFARAGDLWVPLELVTRVIGPALRAPVRWDPARLVLGVGQEHASVTGLRFEEQDQGIALHFTCATPLTYRVESPETGLLVLKIYGGVVDAAQVALAAPRGLVLSVEPQQAGADAQVRVRVAPQVTRYRAYTAQDGAEIVLALEQEPLGALPEPTPRGRREAVPVEPGPLEAKPLDVRVVAIDPGHGGDETGRVGVDGVVEKDVNLAVARELKRWLEREGGLRVVLTRDDDTSVPLAQRAEIANEADGDLFLSLHCNGWFGEQASGVETCFLAPASAAGGGAAAQDDDLAFVRWDLVQDRWLAESGDLAEVVQASLCQALGAGNRGVKQAGIGVLVGAAMPAVLVELGFLSNPDEAKQLADADHQRLIAGALGKAILEFRDRHAGAGRPGAEEARR